MRRPWRIGIGRRAAASGYIIRSWRVRRRRGMGMVRRDNFDGDFFIDLSLFGDLFLYLIYLIFDPLRYESF